VASVVKAAPPECLSGPFQQPAENGKKHYLAGKAREVLTQKQRSPARLNSCPYPTLSAAFEVMPFQGRNTEKVKYNTKP
jgi:hypothetical protein